LGNVIVPSSLRRSATISKALSFKNHIREPVREKKCRRLWAGGSQG
jgi:hypothetical protein